MLRRCINKAQGLQFKTQTLSEYELADLTLENIERELQQLNVNMAEANDIAMLVAFSPFPANLGNDSRKALGRLREKLMERAKSRAEV